jgi:hypothetical protein
MIKRLALIAVAAAVGVLVWSLFATAAARKATKGLNIAAPTFVARDYSDHNEAESSACGTFTAHNGDGENLGDLDNAEGSYFAPVSLPGGATVRGLSVLVNDNDGAADTHAYLIRKRIGAGITPKDKGYRVMAHAQSSGAVNNVIRKFTDSTVVGAKLDYTLYMYYVELVVCPVTEPFAVRITYTQ